jgi:hypothetical protein
MKAGSVECPGITDAKGVRWCVFDLTFGPLLAALGKQSKLPLGDRRANYRHFVSETGARRVVRFENRTPGSERALDEATLQRQLTDARDRLPSSASRDDHESSRTAGA